MKKKVYIFVLCIFTILYVIRVHYVHENVVLPTTHNIPQGEGCKYNGVEYTIVDVKMYDKDEYFDINPEYIEYKVEDLDYKVMIVSVRLDKYEDNPHVTQLLWLHYGYCATAYNPFMCVDMNPELQEEQTQSGLMIDIPYELYKDNLNEERWDNIEELDMFISVGTYPDYNKLLIEEVDYE